MSPDETQPVHERDSFRGMRSCLRTLPFGRYERRQCVKTFSIEPLLHVGPIEALDGTPVIDIKPVVEANDF